MHHYKVLFNSNYHLSNLVKVLFLLLLGTSITVKTWAQQKDPKFTYKPTKIKEISFFKDLPGGNYTIGYGYDDHAQNIIPLAVYDKTFPVLVNKKQLLKLTLASIGVGDLNLETLKSKIHKAKLKHKKRMLENYFLKNLVTSKNTQEEKVLFDKNWWKNPKIPWKESCQPDLNHPPKKIPVDCILWEKASIKSKSTQMIKTSLQTPLIEKSPSQTLQKSSYFLRQSDGNYELFVGKDRKVPPVKIIDLRGYNSSYKRAVSWTVQTNVVKGVIGQIPCLVIPQIVVSILERFFNYIEVLYLLHHNEALNLIVEAKYNQTNSPFYGVLNQEELDHSIQYLRRSSTFISAVIRNLFAKKETISEKYLEKINKKRIKNLKQLERRGYKVIPFKKTNYALGIKRNQDNKISELQVFSLLKRKTLRRKPHAVIDFLDPLKEYFKRNILEATLVASNFIYVAIPVIPALAKTVFKEIAIREMQRYQIQEAGFKSYLDYNKEKVRQILMNEGISEDKSKHYIKLAYKIIKLRSLNPLVLTQKQKAKRKWQSELWIKSLYSNYEPL